jgi:DNA-binding transcriptional regulator/RsmH inhibitor MraZ
MIIGLMRKLEVWSPDRWEDTYDDNQSTQFDTNAHLMNLQL